MKLLHTISRSLGLTPNEGRIAIFLAAGLLAGVAIKGYLAFTPSRQFEYHTQDSIFSARTAMGAPDEVLASESSDDPAPSEDSTAAVANEERVNINTAARDQLLQLPAVGEKTADLILAYRREHGRFKSVKDLLNVRGIGEKKLGQMAPYISL